MGERVEWPSVLDWQHEASRVGLKEGLWFLGVGDWCWCRQCNRWLF